MCNGRKKVTVIRRVCDLGRPGADAVVVEATENGYTTIDFIPDPSPPSLPVLADSVG